MSASVASIGLVLLASTLGVGIPAVDALPATGAHTRAHVEHQQLVAKSSSSSSSSVAETALRRRASAGCGNEHSFAGESNEFEIESSGGTRSYRIHLPSTYDANDPHPLLVAFHGAGSNPEDFEQVTSFSDEGVNPDMIAVYPAGIDGYWQGPTYARDGVSDKVFTTDLVNHLKAEFCVDPDRVYATGHSNGGGFVGMLACSPGHGGQFAAFAPVSAALYTDVEGDENCDPARWPMPIMETHGTADPTIPYGGGQGRGGMLPAIPEWVSRWADRDRCSTDDESEVESCGDGVVEQTWTCTAETSRTDYQRTAAEMGQEAQRSDVSGALVKHVKLEGHDHAYPGEDDDQVFISPMIVEFFEQFSRPEA